MLNKRHLVATLVLAVTLTGLACKGEEGAPPPADPKPRPRATDAVRPPKPNPTGQQPAPVQGDPSAHNKTPGELDLHVEWISENRNTPACEWSLNAPGVGQPCANMERGEKADPDDRDYIGLWEHTITAKAGDVIFLSAQGAGTKSLHCTYYWKGAYHALPDDGKRHCGGTATLN